MHRPLLVGLVAPAIALAIACETDATSTPDAASSPASAQSAATSESSPTLAPTPTATPTPEPTATPTPLSISAQEVLQASFAAMQAVEALHFETNAVVPLTVSGQTLDIPVGSEGDYKPPDNFQGTISATIIFLTIESQIIRTGDTTYLLDPRNGEWKVFPGEILFFVGPNADIEAALASFDDPVVVGEETLDGVQTYHLEGTISADAFGDIDGEFQIGLWAGVEDSRLRQVTVQGGADLGEEVNEFFASLSGLGVEAKGTLSLTLKISDFDTPVSIEPPDLGS